MLIRLVTSDDEKGTSKAWHNMAVHHFLFAPFSQGRAGPYKYNAPVSWSKNITDIKILSSPVHLIDLLQLIYFKAIGTLKNKISMC